MEFKLEQLSPSNLASIFNAAFVDAKVNEEETYCELKVNYKTGVWADTSRHKLSFSYIASLDDSFDKERANHLVNALNEGLGLLNIYCLDKRDKEDLITLVFRYDHTVFNYLPINGKTLINLHRLFEQKIGESYRIYTRVMQEIAQSK